MHQALEHRHERAAFARLERRQDQPLRRLYRRLDVPDQAAARGGDVQRFGAAVGRTVDPPDQALLFQAADDVADR